FLRFIALSRRLKRRARAHRGQFPQTHEDCVRARPRPGRKRSVQAQTARRLDRIGKLLRTSIAGLLGEKGIGKRLLNPTILPRCQEREPRRKKSENSRTRLT